MSFTEFFYRQTRYSPASARRTTKGEAACSGRSYQRCFKPTPQFALPDLPISGGSSSFNRAVIIGCQRVVHVAEAFDVFGRDQTRSIATGVWSILPVRWQIFP